MPYDLLVRVDLSTTSHRVCLLDPEGTILRKLVVERRAQDISVFVDELIELANGQPHSIAIAIKRPHGGLVESFFERGLHVYSLNRKALDRCRDRHTVAGAKDDRLDAYVLADAPRTDRPRFRSVDVDQPLVLQIRELSRANGDLSGELNRLTNRFRDQVHRCTPHLLQLCASGDEPWFWELVGRLVGSDRWTRVQRRSVAGLLKRRRIRRWTPDEVLAVLREPSISVAPGAAEAAQLHIDLLLPHLRIVHEQRKRCKKELEARLEEFSDGHDGDGPSDVDILRSLPGVGVIVMGTLFAEAAPLLAQADGTTLRSYSGQAPITRRSGKSCHVVMRRACNERLREALYHWARVSTTCDPAARAHYHDLRSRGHTHGRALQSVADRWIRILMAMLRDRTLYCPEHPRSTAVEAAA